jgi:hypothetical protein
MGKHNNIGSSKAIRLRLHKLGEIPQWCRPYGTYPGVTGFELLPPQDGFPLDALLFISFFFFAFKTLLYEDTNGMKPLVTVFIT